HQTPGKTYVFEADPAHAGGPYDANPDPHHVARTMVKTDGGRVRIADFHELTPEEQERVMPHAQRRATPFASPARGGSTPEGFAQAMQGALVSKSGSVDERRMDITRQLESAINSWLQKVAIDEPGKSATNLSLPQTKVIPVAAQRAKAQYYFDGGN